MSDLFLSASKIKTAQGCSWKYWANYVLKLPQTGNEGSSRGWICHLIFELLGEKKHKKHYNLIIKSGSINSSKAIYKLVKYHAKKLLVADEDNMELMDVMILKGLLYDFFGAKDKKLTKGISEESFEIKISEEGKSYKVRGFIDKLFLYDRGKKAVIRDFKTSKQLFKGKEITDNLQNLMYCLAVRKLYPKVKEIDVEFLFLKFNLEEDLLGVPGSGVVRMERISDQELEGFEYQLSTIQNYLENFDENDAMGDYAANQEYPSDKTFGGPLMCGKEGFKKSKGEYVLAADGSKIPSYICEHRLPLKYYAVLDSKNEIVKTYKLKGDIKLTDGQLIEERNYEGCPHFNKRKQSFLV